MAGEEGSEKSPFLFETSVCAYSTCRGIVQKVATTSPG